MVKFDLWTRHRSVCFDKYGNSSSTGGSGCVTESLYATEGGAGYNNTPSASSPYLASTSDDASPLELTKKKLQHTTTAGSTSSVAFSHGLLQSQTQFLNSLGTTISSTTRHTSSTCIKKWEPYRIEQPTNHASMEPRQFQVPSFASPLEANILEPSQSMTTATTTTTAACKRQITSLAMIHRTPPAVALQQPLLPPPPPPPPTTTTTIKRSLSMSSSTSHHHNLGGAGIGCSRTIPLSWSATTTTSQLRHQQHHHHQQHISYGPNRCTNTRVSSAAIVQIKREPCQVSEVTTTNYTSTSSSALHTAAVHVKFEQQQQQQQIHQQNTTTTKQVSIMDGNSVASAQTSAIPVGIAVARQRLQETTTTTHQPTLKTSDINRSFGIGLSDLGTCTPSLSQNMFFTGTNSTMIPLSTDAVTMGVSTRSTPTLWQYPSPATVPIEPMLPPVPPVGFQLMRDPNTGQLLFLPTTTTIEKVLCMSYAAEPFQPTVVWPQYTQAAAHTLQPQQLLIPPLSQTMQAPPPLAPLQLLGPDYLASATLHQHTQTQHTRLVALTSDNKRKSSNGMPHPITSHALIKLEDMHHNGASPHHSIFEPEKQMSTHLTTAVQTSDIPAQLYYHHHQQPTNLIQIAPHSQSTTIVEATTTDCRSPEVQQCASPEPEPEEQTTIPEVQDANIQTSPVMSEDDASNQTATNEDAECQQDDAPSSTFETMCHAEQQQEIHSTENHQQQQQQQHQQQEEIVTSSETVAVPIIKPKVEVLTPEKNQCVIFPSRFSSSLNETIAPSSTGCDVYGLELLTRSIEVLDKKITTQITTTTASSNIKEEPMSPQPETTCLSPAMIRHQEPEHLEGLNILCAVIEQRLDEEAGCKASPTSSEEFESRKRKHKHNSKKSSKRTKRERSRSRDRKRKHDEDSIIKHSLHRVKAKYSKCSCPDRHEDGHRCHQTNWPTTAEIISVMESDVKERLVHMMRKCEEKKRELAEINPMVKTIKEKKLLSDRESSATPPSVDKMIVKPSSFSSSLSSLKLSSMSALSPSFSSTASESTGDNPKASSDTDSSKSEELETSSSERSSKRKGGTPKRHDDSPNTETIVAKKPKSLIGYILASKDRVSETNVKGMVYANSIEEMKTKNHKLYPSPSIEMYTTESSSDSSYKMKKKPQFKIEGDETTSAFSIFGDKKLHKATKKHAKKKKSKRHEREKEAERNKIDERCILKEHQLERQIRVLISMGGLFYAGTLSAIQPQDIYAVKLDGERGNRSHIMSKEEVLNDAILEVAPRTIDELPPGTRMCAYWSQQYRCLYPGTISEPRTPDPETDENYVNVEFDDGDNGRIPIEHVRFLLSGYPLVARSRVEYDSNPLDTKNKRKRAASTTVLEHEPIIPVCSNLFNPTIPLDRSVVDNYREERKRQKKHHKEKERDHKKKSKCYDDNCKHRKHKHKRRKHKKHHREQQQDEPSSPLNDASISPDESVSQIADFGREIPVATETEPVPKEDNLTEEEAGSTVTESSGSVYEPRCSKKSLNLSSDGSSKIAPFLPARQLWAWAGKGFKRATGRAKKQFYKSIQRGKEAISVGDSAVFLSTGPPNRPYIGHIESMWENAAREMKVRVKWFYHPEETEGAPNLKYPGALFESPHEDENDVLTISHKCEVLSLDAYTAKFGDTPKKYRLIYDNNDTYYKAGYYDPTTQKMKMEPDIPVLGDNEKWA